VPNTVGKIMVAFGIILILCGLGFLPAGFGPDGDPSVMAGSMGIFSLGSLATGLGFYLNARQLGTGRAEKKPEKKAPPAFKLPPCEACEETQQVMICTKHGAALCASCMHTHFDARSCLLTPASRQMTKTAAARA
jgi:hypothetical protein